MTPQEALLRQRELEKMGARMNATANLEPSAPMITTQNPTIGGMVTTAPAIESATLRTIQESSPLGVTANTQMAPSTDVGGTLEMIRKSKLINDPKIRRQVEAMEEKYSPVGDYIKSKGGR